MTLTFAAMTPPAAYDAKADDTFFGMPLMTQVHDGRELERIVRSLEFGWSLKSK
jgi:hypothetical protein